MKSISTNSLQKGDLFVFIIGGSVWRVDSAEKDHQISCSVACSHEVGCAYDPDIDMRSEVAFVQKLDTNEVSEHEAHPDFIKPAPDST